MTAPAVSETSLTTGAVANSGPETENVAPLHCDSAEHGQQNAEQENAEELAVSDAKWGVFQELRPQFEGLLPPSVVLDCVDHAVQDLLGSINVEALPEMAIRLAAVRLDPHRGGTGKAPGEPQESAAGTDSHPSGASRNPTTTPPFSVIRPPTPGYPPVAMTVTVTRAASWSGTE
jgi:hypothetical protein